MLEYNRIDTPEGIYINKINVSKECKICHYWNFKYETYICNGLLQKAISFNDVPIVYVKGSPYRFHF